MPWVGKRLPRLEDAPLLTGRGVFVADAAKETLYLRMVRSAFAHGRIIGIDIPDGATVFTADDLADLRTIRPLLHRNDFIPVEQPVLARDRVLFAGQAIAAVVADSLMEAEDIADQVFVDIEPLDHVTDLHEALAEDAPLVHDHVPRNTIIDAHLETSGFSEAMEGAAHQVDVTIRSHRQNAMPLETRGGYAEYDARSGTVVLTASTQGPFVDRTAISDILGIPDTELRVIAKDVGGAFGQKHPLAIEDVVAVWAARRLRRSVTWIEDRRENFTSSFHSRDHEYIVTGGFDREGHLVALQADIRCNVGAYSCYPVTCGVEPLMALADMPGPYDVRQYSARARAIATNACPIAPYRGVSRPVVTLSLERLMDTAAKQVGLDAVEIRRRNLITTFPYTSVTGATFDNATYAEALEKAVIFADVDGFRASQARVRSERRYIGIGFSTYSERTGSGTPTFSQRKMDVTLGFETVEVTVGPSGYVEARVGASPHGQGLETSLAQLIADELGVEPTRVKIIHGDTDRTPFGWGTFASRSMVVTGGACKLAAQEVRKKIADIASDHLEVAVEDLTFEDGQVKVAGTDVGVGIETIARTAYYQSHTVKDGGRPGLSATATYDPEGTFSNGCHVAIVEVDIETGKVDLQKFFVVEDAGILVNPMIAEGQVAGGIAQGIGNALLEELVYDDEGNLVTASLMDFLVPTAAEIPTISIDHLVSKSDATITGAKGLGEGGAIGAPAAVLNAINDALAPLGVEVNTMPATPERIHRLIAAALARLDSDP